MTASRRPWSRLPGATPCLAATSLNKASAAAAPTRPDRIRNNLSNHPKQREMHPPFFGHNAFIVGYRVLKKDFTSVTKSDTKTIRSMTKGIKA